MEREGAPPASEVPTVVALTDDPLVGRVLDGKYELLGRLGEGGMGAVYRASRVHIGDEVAVKVLHSKLVTDETLVERFRREARAAAQLHHPNVVTIHDYGEAQGAGGFAYIVMELVRGTSLRELLRREGRLETARAVSLMRDICAGVGAAHRREIVHRDIKPDNIIVLPADEEHERERIKVVDFGIAKLRDLASDSVLTQTGVLVGTPFYMSPEQCRGEHLDARADVYSLGALLHEMLAGSPPFNAPSVTGVIAKHLTEAPPPLPRDLNVPPALRAAISRSLSKLPEGRQQDAAEFAREIQAAMSDRERTTPEVRTTGGVGQSEPTAPIFPAVSNPAPVTPIPPAHTPAHGPASQTHSRATGPRTFPQGPPPHTHGAPPRRKSRAPLVVGLILLLLMGAGVLGVAGLFWLGQQNAGETVNVNTNSGGRRTTATPKPSNTNVERNEANRPVPTPVNTAAVQKEVAAVLDGWVASTTGRNLSEHMRYYSDTLETYYLKQKVPARQVHADRERAFTRYDEMDVTLSNIQIKPDASGTRATAVFDKTWEFAADDKHSTGSVRQQLNLVKIGDRWLIVGEKDLRVHYQNSEEF